MLSIMSTTLLSIMEITMTVNVVDKTEVTSENFDVCNEEDNSNDDDDADEKKT